MSSGKLAVIAAVAAAVAVGLSTWVLAASGGSPSSRVGDRAAYAPVQSISYRFGSKAMSGYFVRQVQQAPSCVVTLMITERSDPDQPTSRTPARLRLVLYPGQIAGFDSAEGGSLNLTCGVGATTVLVDACEAGGTRGAPRIAASERRCPGA
jgi:hypothetical protein